MRGFKTPESLLGNSSTSFLKKDLTVRIWYETAPIQSPLDNHELFEITSPKILNRNNVPEGMLPVEVRAEDVNQRLFRALLRTIRAKQTSTVTINTLNKRPVIQISDDQSTRPIRLVTVTEPDADFNGKTSTTI